MTILDQKSTGKRVVLLGDMHFMAPHCRETGHGGYAVSISTYLLKNVIEPQSFMATDKTEWLDIFLEVPYALPEYVQTLVESKRERGQPKLVLEIDELAKLAIPNYIHKIAMKFGSCFQWGRKGCSFNRVRFHNADVRDGVFMSSATGVERLEQGDIIAMHRKIYYRWGLTRTERRTFAKWITKFMDGDLKWLFDRYKISKQLGAKTMSPDGATPNNVWNEVDARANSIVS